MASDGKRDDFYVRPPVRTWGQRVKLFIWDPSTQEFFGRTALSWGQIILFYTVFYGLLAGIFAVMITIFFNLSINEQSPKLILNNSLTGVSPGMGFRPSHPNPEVTTISYNTSDQNNIQFWTETIDTFLAPYENSGKNIKCDYDGKQTSEKHPCVFEAKFKVCNRQNSYGYAKNKPCLFLKMNKIFGWKPEPYTKKEIEKNEMGMPDNLRKTILGYDDVKKINNNIWVSCSDAHNDKVTFEFDGHPGFPSYYYPYTNQKNYQTPLVAVQINNLPTGRSTSQKIVCRLWAKNIQYDRKRMLGMTNIELTAN